MEISSVAIFCGSKNGHNSIYEAHAKVLGTILASRGVSIVYGGGKRGLMGIVAESALAAKGKVVGIIPKLLVDFEQQNDELTEVHVVETIHIRKQLLYEYCDAAVVLPGGLGTLDEAFEILTWNQLEIHHKKVFLMNSDGFYDHLIAHFKTMEETGFLYDHFAGKVTILSTPEEIIPYLSIK